MVEERIYEPANMEDYRNSAYYQSLGIEQLQQQLGGYQTDDGALREQAEAQYRPGYEAEIESIRQELEKQVQGYGSQLDALGSAYDRQRRQANRAYDESAVALNNALTKRGLGRSSLVSTQGVHLENRRNEALGDIDRDERSAIDAINEKIALLTDQAARREQTLAGNYARQLESRVGELREQNRSAAVSLQLQIAALQQKGYEAYQQWLLDQRKQELAEKEFEAEHPELFGGEEDGGSSGSSGSTGGGSKTSAKKPKEETSVAGGALIPLMEKLKETVVKKTASESVKTAAKKAAESAKEKAASRLKSISARRKS